MTYNEARVYLDEVSKYGSVLGLDTVRDLLRELGNPQDDLKFIHIAGTNGKGSVLAYTSTILSEAGYRVGRYVSPTVVSYLERIQIDGEWIPEDEFAACVEEVQRAIASMEAKGETSPTVFEAETAIAFLYFRKKKCDLVVLETGLGGTLDATNIVQTTNVAAFTSISKDHMSFLGNTLREIADNKAGIMKSGCTAITFAQHPDVMLALEKKAAEVNCHLKIVNADTAVILEESFDGQRFQYGKWNTIELPLAGPHQVVNAVVVLGVLEALIEQGYQIPESAVYNGFKNTVWPGRFTCVSRNPIFIVDGAHNEDAVRGLKESVVRYFQGEKLIFIMGIFKDKEYEKIVQMMAPLAERIYTVTLPDEGRTLLAEELRDVVIPYCAKCQAMASIEDAVLEAYKTAEQGDVVLAFGSLSYLGQVMECVKEIGENR